MMAQRMDEELHIRTPAHVSQFHGVAIGELTEIVRQLIRLRHAGSAQQDGDDGNIAPKRGSYFDPDEVVGIVETPISAVIAGFQPVLADEDEQGAAAAHVLIDGLAEVASGFERGDVHEDCVFAELRGEVIEETAGFALGVLSPIAEK